MINLCFQLGKISWINSFSSSSGHLGQHCLPAHLSCHPGLISLESEIFTDCCTHWSIPTVNVKLLRPRLLIPTSNNQQMLVYCCQEQKLFYCYSGTSLRSAIKTLMISWQHNLCCKGKNASHFFVGSFWLKIEAHNRIKVFI